MENQLQISKHNLSTPLNKKEVEIAKTIWHVNQLISYPLTDYQIESWAKTINEYYKNIDLNILNNIIKEMKLGKIEWDYHKGIQNIFTALSSKGIVDDETEENIKIRNDFYSKW